MWYDPQSRKGVFEFSRATAALGRTTTLPAGGKEGVLSAQLRRPARRSATAASRRFGTSPRRLNCANSGRSGAGNGSDRSEAALRRICPRLPWTAQFRRDREARTGLGPRARLRDGGGDKWRKSGSLQRSWPPTSSVLVGYRHRRGSHFGAAPGSAQRSDRPHYRRAQRTCVQAYRRWVAGRVSQRGRCDAMRHRSAKRYGRAQRRRSARSPHRIPDRHSCGDVVEESDGDLMGDSVNIAARLEGIAKPGAICLSEQAYWQVKARLDIVVSDLGATQLRSGMTGPTGRP
jgi:hypothetical protein